MSEWIIVGDTEKYKDCLVRPCGKCKERAQAELDRMLTNPNKYDLALMSEHSNLRIEEVPDEACWWNDPFLCN